MNSRSSGTLGVDVQRWGEELKGLKDINQHTVHELTGLGGGRLERLVNWAYSEFFQNSDKVARAVRRDRMEMRSNREERELKTKYRHLLEQHEKLDAELDAALSLAAATLDPIKIDVSGGGESEAVAFAIASDWHVEERVEAATVNGLNKYNLEVAEYRAKKFFERALRMVKKEQQDVKIETLVLALLGDFITGRIHEENLETCDLRPMDAILFAQRLVYSGIKFLLENSDLKLVIPCRPGNHSRITKFVHAATEDGNALETLMYASLAQQFAGEERVTFEIQPSYHCILDVMGHTVRLHHGHAIKFGGGVGGLHIPLRKAIAQWNMTQRAELDILGHWHSYSASTRNYIVNGSLIGISPYGIRIRADYEDPIQAFFLLDRARGVTVQIPLLVD